jgi:hypothetical protein
MGDLFQGARRGGDAGGVAGASQLFGQMLTMPFSAFVYGMQLLVQMLQGVQGMTGRGAASDMTCGACGGAPGDVAGAGTSPQITRKEDRKMSDQSWGGGGQNTGGGQGYGGGQSWSVRDECRNLEPCDQLRLVRYKVLFLKRDLEVAFPEEEELVAEEMNEAGFVAWKIAEFIQKMGRKKVELPGKWAEKNYPPAANPPNVVAEGGKHYVVALPDQDKRFLRVYVQVLATYDRERTYYERDQIKVLEQIRDRLG